MSPEKPPQRETLPDLKTGTSALAEKAMGRLEEQYETAETSKEKGGVLNELMLAARCRRDIEDALQNIERKLAEYQKTNPEKTYEVETAIVTKLGDAARILEKRLDSGVQEYSMAMREARSSIVMLAGLVEKEPSAPPQTMAEQMLGYIKGNEGNKDFDGIIRNIRTLAVVPAATIETEAAKSEGAIIASTGLKGVRATLSLLARADLENRPRFK